MRILESSGHTELDTAALRIVRLAAPYQDFPVEMRKNYDQLEIIRDVEVLTRRQPARQLMNLKHHFLIAMPALTGSYFGGTITYVCEHSDDGAMGLMINRPSELSLAELCDQSEIEVKATQPPDPVRGQGAGRRAGQRPAGVCVALRRRAVFSQHGSRRGRLHLHGARVAERHRQRPGALPLPGRTRVRRLGPGDSSRRNSATTPG